MCASLALPVKQYQSNTTNLTPVAWHTPEQVRLAGERGCVILVYGARCL